MNTGNNTMMSDDDGWGTTKSDIIIESILLSILALCILFGNSLVCLAFATERKLQTTTNCFVVSLACSDILVGLLIIPLYIYIKNEQVLFDELTYEVWLDLEIIACSASIASLVAISIERCLSVKLPAFHRNISRRVVHVAITLIWIHAIFISGALLNFYSGGIGKRKPWMAVYRSIMSFFLPFIIIAVAYSFIFNVAISRSRRHHSSVKRDIRIATTIAVVIGAFVCAWLPFFTLSILAAYQPYLELNWKVALVAVKWLQYLNSVVNPIIYTYGNQDFRKAFLKLLRCFKNHGSRFDSTLTGRSRSDSRHESRTDQTNLRSTNV